MFRRTVQDYWLPTPFLSFPFTSPPVRRRVPSGSECAVTPTNAQLHNLYFFYYLAATCFDIVAIIRKLTKTEIKTYGNK